MKFVLVVLAALAGGVAVRVWLRRSAKPGHSQDGRSNHGVPVSTECSERWRISGSSRNRGGDGIDERTWQDLDVDRLIPCIDRSRTLLGRQALHAALRSNVTPEERLSRNALVSRFLEDDTSRAYADVLLRKLGNSAGANFWHVTQPGLPPPPHWHWLIPGMTITTAATLAGAIFKPVLFGVFISLVLANAFIRAWAYATGTTVVGPMRQAGPLMAAAVHLRRDPGIAASSGIKDLDDALAALGPLRRYTRWLGSDPLNRSEMAATFHEYLNLAFLVEANAAFFGARHLIANHGAMKLVAEWVGDVDLALSVAVLHRSGDHWTAPTWDDSAIATSIRELRHPMLDAAVTSDLMLVTGRGLILTGANMSGKSTLIRSVGVAALLARTLDLVPAHSWHGREFIVCSSIGGSDDLARGKSFYMAEAERVAEMIRATASPRPLLLLVDELFRGTNTVERIAAGEAVLRRLLLGRNGVPTHVTVAATHDRELAELLGDRYAPWCLEGDVIGGILTFDYNLRPGISRHRTAVALLEQAGVPASVITDARTRSDQMERQTGRTPGSP